MEQLGGIKNTDKLLDELGGCGKFQYILMVVMCLMFLPALFNYNFTTFSMYNPGWTCLDNVTYSTVNDTMMGGNSSEGNLTYTRSCEGFSTCEHVQFLPGTKTLVTEWGLACDKGYILQSIISMRMAAMALSTLLSGYVGDKYGRKIPFIVSLCIGSVVGFAMAFSVSWQMYAAVGFIMGLNYAFMSLIFIVLVEYVVAKWRVRMFSIPINVLIGGLFVLILVNLKDWRMLTIGTNALGTATILPMLWIPKSLRWLSTNGKNEEVYKLACRIARLNNAPEPKRERIDALVEKYDKEDTKTKKFTYISLAKKGYRLSLAIVTFSFFVRDLTWFAMSLGVAMLPGNFYINLLLFNLSSLPANGAS